MNDRRDQLYDNLINSGKVSEAEIGNRDEFKAAISDEAKTRQFYQNIIGSKLLTEDEIGSEDDFYGSISDDFATPQQQTPVSGGGYQPSAEEIKGFMGTIGGARQAVGQSQQAVNRIGNMQQRVGLDLPQDVRINIGENKKVTRGEKRINIATGQMEQPYVTTAGNKYSSRAMADLEQNAVDDQKRREANPVGTGLEDAYQEQRRLEGRISELEAKQNAAMKENNGFVYRDKNLFTDEEDAELQNLKAARRQNDQRIIALERERDDYDPQGIIGTVGKAGADFFRGMYDAARNPSVTSFGITDLADMTQLYKVKRKIDAAKEAGVEPELNESEQALLQNTMLNGYTQSEYGKNRSSLYGWGQIAMQAIPFVGEFALTGGFSAISQMGAKAGARTAEKMALDGLKKSFVKNTGVVMGDLASGWAMANTTGAAKTAADILDRHIGEVDVDENGNYYFKEGKSLAEAVYEGELVNTFEYYTEKLGDHLNIGGFFAKGAEKYGLSKLSKAVTFLSGSKAMKALGVHDYPSEVIEEEANLLLNATFGLDNNFSTEPLQHLSNKVTKELFGKEYFNVDPNSKEYQQSIFNGKTQKDIVFGMFFSLGVLNAPRYVQTGYTAAQYKRYQNKVNVADAQASTVFGADNWQMIKEQIDNCTNEDMAQLMQTVSDGKMTPEQKAATANYAAKLMTMRGYNSALASMLNGGEEDATPQAQASNAVDQSYTAGYDTQEPDLLKQFKDEAQQSADNLPKYGEEFAKMVTESQDPVATLTNLMEKRDIYSDEQIAAAADYFQKMSRVNGAMDGALDRIDREIENANSEVIYNTHQASGQVIDAKIGDGAYYIIGGDVVTDEETGMPVVVGTGGAVVVMDPVTGEKSVKPASQVTVTSMQSADEMIQYNENVLRQQLMQQADDDFTYGSPANEVFQSGDKVTLRERDGNVIEGQVIVPETVDGQFQVITSDNKSHPYSFDDLNLMIVSHNGQPVQRGSTLSPESDQVSDQVPENAETGTDVNGNVPEGQTNGQINTPETPSEEVQQPENQPEGKGEETEQPQSAASRIPLDENNQPDYIKAKPEDSYDALVEEMGEEDSNAIIESELADAQKRLSRIQKRQLQGATIEEKKRSLAERRAAMEEEQSKIDYWNSVLEIPKARKAEAERKAAEEELRRAEEERMALMQTPEGRQQLLSDAGNSQERAAVAKEIYGDYFNENIGDPDTVEELVSLLLPYGKLNWEGYDRGTSHVRGLQEELGSGHSRGLSKDRGTSGFNSYLAKKGEGDSLDEIVHSMYEDDSNLIGGEHRFTTEEIKDAVIDMLLSAEKPRDIRDYTINSRIAMAERTLRAEQEAEAEDWADFYHLNPEEREAFEAYMQQQADEFSSMTDDEIREIISIFADEYAKIEEYEQQNRSSQELDQQPDEGGNAGEAEGGEGQVSGQPAAEEAAGAGDEGQQPEGAEAGTGQPPVPFDNVPGGTPGAIEPTDEKAGSYQLSNEVNEFGIPFVVSTDGTTTFGEITADSGLTPAPIKLSKGEDRIDDEGRHHGYGLKHIEAGHGKQIRDAGFASVEEFVEQVAKNYDTIREGGVVSDNQTYLLEISDEHNNTLFVQLSRDGKYWNINSAGIFKKKYSRNKSEVYTRPALESGTDTDSSGVNRGQTEGATATSRNSPSTSEGKVTNNSSNLQEKTEKSSPLGKTSSPEEVAAEEAKVDTNPTEGQKEAGNYQKGHIKVDGLDISIENPKGSVRSGVDADGNPWEVTMNNTYGYIRGTESVDGDHIDVFLSDDPTSGNVFVVDQVKPDGSFDEVKVMYGFKDAAEAAQAYLSNYSKGWKGLGAISGVSREAFKEWIESSYRKTKPFRDYALAKREQARQAKENENKLNNDDVISDIDENDVPLQKRSSKSYTDREGVYHEGLEEELQNIEQALRQMVEGSTEEGNGESERRTPAELRRRASIIRAELAGRQRAREELRQKYNINDKGDISLDDLTRMFRDLNSDEAVGRLFERVLNVLKKLKLDYRFTDKLPGGVNGRAQTLLNMTFYDWDAQTRDMDDQQKARVLLHEMIHNVTSQILLYARNMPLLLALSSKQLSAARKLNRIYKEVKKASPKRANGKDFYALDSVDEMVAELANPEFREALSQIEADGRSLWQRIKDAIREMLGLETTPNMSNALKESGDVLEDILDTFGPVRSFVHGVPRQAMEAGEKIFGDNENLTDSTEADLQNSKGNDIQDDSANKGDGVISHKAEAALEAPAQKEKTLRDALVGLLKAIGIDVITDNAEGQRTLDEANGKVSQSKVYHGSGAEFDAFDHSHMGEGAGSQAFGYGTYVTDSQRIGKGYAKQVSRGWLYKGKNSTDLITEANNSDLTDGRYNTDGEIVGFVLQYMDMGSSFEEAVAKVRKMSESAVRDYEEDMDHLSPDEKKILEGYREEIKFIDSLKPDDFKKDDRYLYDVEIPDDTGSNYLDWQEPVSDELLEKVSDALTDQESDDVNADYYLDKMDQFVDMNNPLGSDLYKMLQKYAFNGDAEKTSRFLGSIGFTGNKYPAGTIMGNGNGATNYVIFNEGDAKITNRTKFFRTKDGQAYGYTYNGKIYLDPGIATAETPVHEYTHLWAEAVRQKDPKTWDNIVDVLKNDPAVRPFWEKVAAQYPELTDENDIAEEVLAQYSGKRGSDKLREVADGIARENGGIFGRAQAVEALRKMKNILARFWKAVADVMGWQYTKADEIADEVLYDLLSGVKPETEGRAEVREQRVPGSERPDLNTPSQEVNEYNKRLEQPENFSWGKSIYMVPIKKTWRKYVGGRFREAWQDSMITLRRAQDIIAKVSGKPLQDYENAYAQENLSHGATKNEYEWFDRNLYKPLLKSFNALKKAMGAKDDAEVHRYMFAKHGLERNVVMAFRDAVKRHVQAAERDYESRKKAYEEAETRIKQKERNVQNLEQLGFNDKAEEKRKELNRLKAAFERRKVPEKPQTEAEVHKAYQADEGRIQNEKDFREGRIDYRTYRERDDQIRAAYAPESYFILRSNDYSGLTGLFAETKEVDGVEVTEKPGVSEAEDMALKLVDGIEKQHGPLTEDLWQKVNCCTKWTLQKSWQSGMLSRESYDVISGMYDFYIPLRGWDGTNAQDVYDYVGGRSGVFSKAVIPAKGRTSVADNPIAYIGNMAMSNIIIGNQNRVKQCLLNLSRNHPNELLRPDKAWYENIGDENNPNWVAVTPDIPADATPEEINQILDEFNRRMRQLKADGKATQTRGSLHISYPAPDPQLKEHEVRVLEGGNEYVIYVNGDPRVAQAVNGTRARKVRNGSGLVTKLAERSGRFKAAVYTSLSPAFVISNWFRDITMAVTSSLIDKGIGYNATAARNTAALLNPFNKNNIFRMMWLFTHDRLDMQSPTQRMFKEFMMAGGETGFIAQLDLERFKDDISKELGRSGQHYYNPKKIFRGYLNCTEFVNRCIEDSTRFIVYKTSRQQGESIQKSASDAKDVTLNFNRKGTGELGNAFVRGAYIFVNPSVQGIQTIARLVRNHPYKFTALAAGWIMGGAMQPYLNQMLMELLGPGDDDDRDAYWKLPEHVRRQCLVFYVGNGQFATIPLAQEFRALWGVGETASARLLGHGRGDYVDDGMEIVESFLDLLPLDVLGHGVRDLRFASREWFQAMGMNFVPDIIKTEVEGMANKDWSGKPLYKETENNRNLPSFAKAYKGTPDWLVRATEFLNEHTGGEGSWKPGKVDWNPAIINHELQGWFGGPFNFFGGFGNDIYKAMNGKEVKIYDVPVLNRFVNMPSERDFSQNLGDEYWKMYREEYRPMDEAFSQMKREARNGNAKALQAIENFFQSDDYKRYKEMKEQVDLAEKRKKAAEAGEGAFDFEYTNERAGKTPEQEYSERLNGKDEFEEWCVDQIGKKTAKYATELDNMRKNGASRQEQKEYRSRFALYIEAREAVERYSNERNGQRQALGKVDKDSEEEIMNKIRSKRDELLRIYRFDDIFKKEE